MKKKILKNLLLVVVMAVLCLAVGMTANAETWGDYEYRELEDGTIEIVEYIGKGGEVEIPSEIDGKIVTSLANRIFSHDNSIKSVSIADSVTTIGESAFYNAEKIEHIKLPKNLKTIGELTFFFCFSLKQIELSLENEYFSLDEYGVLFNKDKTELVYYPAAIKSKSYTIPYSVVVIGDYAFNGNTTLEEIVIPEGIVEIKDTNFDLCIGLKKLVFPGSLKNISFILDNPMLGLQSITISNGTKTIDEWFIAYNAMLNDVYVESMDIEFIENDEWDLLGTVLPKDRQEKYFEFLNSTFWEQELNFSDMSIETESGYIYNDLGNEFMSFLNGEFINKGTTIYCHPGSTAEAYAINNSHGVNYVLTHFFKGEWTYDYDSMIRYRKCIHCDELETEALEATNNGDVEIIEPVNPDTDFVVDVVTDYVIIEDALSNSVAGDFEIVKAFDITMTVKDGVHVQPDGIVKVKLPLDWSKDGMYKVYRVNDDGTLTDMNAYRQGSHIVFDTDHFSIYVIVDESEKTDEPVTPDAPQTETKNSLFSKILNWLQSLFDLIMSWFK